MLILACKNRSFMINLQVFFLNFAGCQSMRQPKQPERDSHTSADIYASISRILFRKSDSPPTAPSLGKKLYFLDYQ